MSWQHNRFLRPFYARPRLFISIAIAVAVGAFLPAQVSSQAVTRWLIAWNTARSSTSCLPRP